VEKIKEACNARGTICKSTPVYDFSWKNWRKVHTT